MYLNISLKHNEILNTLPVINLGDNIQNRKGYACNMIANWKIFKSKLEDKPFRLKYTFKNRFTNPKI
jgi:hypothetical protein